MKKYFLLSDYLDINPDDLIKCNILNNFINDDSGYYICLEEIENSNIPEFNNYKTQYNNAIHTIRNELPSILKKGLFSEPKTICLGEVIYGHKGKGMQLSAIKEIKKEVEEHLDYYLDISKFIELAHVSKKIGRDSLNDLLSNVYIENLLVFTENKCSELNISDLDIYTYNGKDYKIKTYQEDNKPFPVIFFPLNIMKKYVYALTYNDLYLIGYKHRASIHKFDEKVNELSKEDFIKNTPLHILSKKIKNSDLNYSEVSKKRTLTGNSKYNNIDIYNEIKDDLIKLSLPQLNDNIEDISNYIYSTFEQIIQKIISIDAGKVKYDKVIVTDNYKQASAFICAKVNELLIAKGYSTKIIITRGNLFVINGKDYNQICIRTPYNISCIDDISDYKKLKEIKNSRRADYKIIICDPNDRFIKFVSDIPLNKRDKFYVLKAE